MDSHEHKTSAEQPKEEVPKHWLHSFLSCFEKQCSIVKSAWEFVCVLVVLGFLACHGLYQHFVLPGRDGEIKQKDATIDLIKEEKATLIRANDKLTKQVEQLRIYRSRDMMPLKKTALILAQQIRDFIKNWKDTDPPDIRYPNIQKYLQRFGLRASIMRDDLDQNGQQSDEFDNVMYHFDDNYQQVRTIASEIERLANKLPD